MFLGRAGRAKAFTLIRKLDGIRSHLRITVVQRCLFFFVLHHFRRFGLAFGRNRETMMRAKTTSLVRTASRSVAARRQLSSEPKMHKAGSHWADLKAKRPVDHDDLHVRTVRRRKAEFLRFQIP